MVDQIVDLGRNWKWHIGTRFVPNTTITPVPYIQDILRSDNVKKETASKLLDIGTGPQIPPDNQALKYSLKWPQSALEDNNYLPYLLGGFVALFGLPFFVPDVALGTTVLTGYSTGGLTYFAQNQNRVWAM